MLPGADRATHFPFRTGNVETGPNCEVFSARKFARIDGLPMVGRVVLAVRIGTQPLGFALPLGREDLQSRFAVHAVVRSARPVYTRASCLPQLGRYDKRDNKMSVPSEAASSSTHPPHLAIVRHRSKRALTGFINRRASHHHPLLCYLPQRDQKCRAANVHSLRPIAWAPPQDEANAPRISPGCSACTSARLVPHRLPSTS